MDTGALKKFSQAARRQLLEQVAARMEQVLQTDSIEIREKEKAVKELQEQINKSSKEAVIDQVAYTWFNRFCALRYMDVNRYARIGIISPVGGFTQPEILQEAKQGVIDDSFKMDKQKVVGLLNGQLPSSNPQQEAYRLLLVGACNAYHTQMPFLFPKIDDYTELLMPDDLLSENSVLQEVRDTLTEEACQDVEVIGWLYQYYISERKDEVFAALKKNKKIEAEDIPAATQLFTPHWIVRYLVENSLGRLWMLNHPNSKLVEQMDYYIKPDEPECDYLEISSPEEIKVCDPACGSGHMLTYAFDMLYAIYEEEGYDAVEIPGLILQYNLYGIEIDQRAGHLAAFALMMKAREKDRRFFSRGIEPNICVLENITFTPEEINNYKKAVEPDLFTQELWFLLQQFEQAKNFGSLIQPQVKNPWQIRERLKELGVFDDMFLRITTEKVKQVVKQATALNYPYNVIICNPPYMGWRGVNSELKEFARDYYPDSNQDTYSMFMERNIACVVDRGFVGMITIPNWMFISSFEKIRKRILSEVVINSLVHNGRGVWGSDFGSCSFVIEKHNDLDKLGTYKRLFTFDGEVNSNTSLSKHFFDTNKFPNLHANANDFKNVPGSPIAYWMSERIKLIFLKSRKLNSFAPVCVGLQTGNNDLFVRFWYEVAYEKIGLGFTNKDEAQKSHKKWFPYNKGGAYRKWYGNKEHIVNWENDGEKIRNYFDESGRLRSRPQNSQWYFQPSITWTFSSISFFGVRYSGDGSVFDVAGSSLFPKDDDIYWLAGFLCSKVSSILIKILNPTISYQVGDVASLPIVVPDKNHAAFIAKNIIEITKHDWESFETSWDFGRLGLLKEKFQGKDLENTYIRTRLHWKKIIQEVTALEEQNNEIFIAAYELEDEVATNVALEEITLTCNPYYRYDSQKSEEELEDLLLADTMKEFISNSVGCMLGRYSLDKGGLILANAGETLEDYLRQVPEPTFMPDEDNVIPVLEGEWFEDDIAERFKDFLKVAFGKENFEENLAFLEEAIGRDIRSYFVKDFYNHHVKMYKKRPIYWLFSSPKGSFNALIYMHRYRPDTLSLILNDYLVQYREKLTAHKALLETRSISAGASQGEKTKALKEIDKINKVLSELKEYEDEILYPLATQQIEIDLDDGVKVNYSKFGKALKKVAGLSEKQ